jgi:hypothetical protein
VTGATKTRGGRYWHPPVHENNLEHRRAGARPFSMRIRNVWQPVTLSSSVRYPLSSARSFRSMAGAGAIHSCRLVRQRRAQRQSGSVRRHHVALVERPDRGADHETQARQTPDVWPRQPRPSPSPRYRHRVDPTPPKVRQSQSSTPIHNSRLAGNHTTMAPGEGNLGGVLVWFRSWKPYRRRGRLSLQPCGSWVHPHSRRRPFTGSCGASTRKV